MSPMFHNVNDVSRFTREFYISVISRWIGLELWCGLGRLLWGWCVCLWGSKATLVTWSHIDVRVEAYRKKTAKKKILSMSAG